MVNILKKSKNSSNMFMGNLLTMWHPGEGHGNPAQCPCLENPRGRGAWWASDHGVAKGRTRLSDLAHTVWQALDIRASFHPFGKTCRSASLALTYRWGVRGSGKEVAGPGQLQVMSGWSPLYLHTLKPYGGRWEWTREGRTEGAWGGDEAGAGSRGVRTVCDKRRKPCRRWRNHREQFDDSAETFRSGWTWRRRECLSLFLHLSAPLSSVLTSSVAGKSSSNSDSLLCYLLRSWSSNFPRALLKPLGSTLVGGARSPASPCRQRVVAVLGELFSPGGLQGCNRKEGKLGHAEMICAWIFHICSFRSHATLSTRLSAQRQISVNITSLPSPLTLSRSFSPIDLLMYSLHTIEFMTSVNFSDS